MADFLDQLPVIPLDELPPNSECIICQIGYGAANDGDTTEHPVRLPCNHVAGSNCIFIWLHPEKEGKNSCPLCRRKFFDLPSSNARILSSGDDIIQLRALRDFWASETRALLPGYIDAAILENFHWQYAILGAENA